MTDPDEKDQIADGPALSADGRLEERMGRVEPAFAPPVEEKLELAERAPKNYGERIEDYRASSAPRRPRVAIKLVLGALTLGVVLLVAFLVFKPKLDVERPFGVTEPSLIDQLNLGERQPVIISSTPAGATVSIGGKVVGQTPWAGDNLWRGDVPVVVQSPGYRRWEGKLEGGKPQTLDVRLKK